MRLVGREWEERVRNSFRAWRFRYVFSAKRRGKDEEEQEYA